MQPEKITISGEGSIREYKKGRVYYIRHRLPPTEPGGERRWSPSRKVYGSKAKARQELEAYRKELEAELNGEMDPATVGDYASQFHEHRINANTIALRTLEREAYEIERIKRTLGNTPLSKLNPAIIVDAYSKLRHDGASQNTVNSMHVKLSQILEKAYREGRIPRNPCKLIDPTETRRPKSTSRRSLTAEQFSQLGEDLLNSRLDGKIVAIWIAMAVGGRKGEILGLEWENVDLSNKTISFEAQLTPKQGRVCRLKTDGSRRACAIDDNTAVLLGNWKALQSELFYDSQPVPETAPVCCNESGGFMSLSGFDRWRRRFFVEHGLGTFKVVEEYRGRNGEKRYRFSGYEGFCLHELRHSQATLLIGDKIDPKTVQARGGWTSIDVPLNIYTHSIEKNDREAAEAIGKRLPRVSPALSKDSADCSTPIEKAAESDRGRSARPTPENVIVEKHRPRAKPLDRREVKRKVLEALGSSTEPMSKRTIAKSSGIASAKCLSTALLSLQSEGAIAKIGNTKSTRYILKRAEKPVTDVKDVTDIPEQPTSATSSL